MTAAGSYSGQSSLDSLFGLAFMFVPVLIGLGVSFGVLFGSIRLARSHGIWQRGAGMLLALVYLVATVLVVLNLVLSSCTNQAIGPGLALLVGAAGMALVIVVAARVDGPFNQGIARWSLPIIVLSFGLGGLGLIGFGAFNAPVQQMGQVQGIGPGNFETLQMLTVLRNEAPIALSMAAAAVGAIAWRVTGRPLGVGATLVGCAGIGANLLLLFLQTGD